MSILVRSYKTDDREVVRQIAFDTALMGDSGANFFDGEELLKDALTLYFTDHEPESIWVAEENGIVVGYIMGAKNEEVLWSVHMTKIFPHLLVALLRSGILISKKNWKLFACFVKGALQGEFKMPKFAEDYPAVLHINLRASCRGNGVGSSLIERLMEYYTKCGIKGVRLATMSIQAAGFFRKNGFELLFQGRRSYLKEALGKDIPVFIFGRRLSC